MSAHHSNAWLTARVRKLEADNKRLKGALVLLAAKHIAVCACGEVVKLSGESLRAHPDRNGNGCILGGAHWLEALKVPLAPGEAAP